MTEKCQFCNSPKHMQLMQARHIEPESADPLPALLALLVAVVLWVVVVTLLVMA